VNDNWVQLGDDINGENEGDGFGGSVALSSDGTIIAVGATGNDDNGVLSGQARIFEYNDINWNQLGEAINGEGVADVFGNDVSLSSTGGIVAISAHTASPNLPNPGYIEVYDLSSLLSTQESTLTNFSFYPNPVTNILTIDLSQSDILQKVSIYNSIGQEVLTSTQSTLDVSSLSKGVYIIEVETATGKSSKKLIIN